MPELKNKRHERFARGIVKGLTHEGAYIHAGYKRTGARANAARLIAHDSVRARIAELNAKLEKRDVADAAEVRRFWTAVLRGEIKEKRVYGKEPLEFELPPLIIDRLRSSELLAKAMGVFKDAVEDAAVMEAARAWADELKRRRAEAGDV